MDNWPWFTPRSARQQAPLPSPSKDIARETAKLKEEVSRLSREVGRLKDTRAMFEELVRSVRRMQ